MKETVLTQPIANITEHGTKVSANVIGASGTITSRDGALRYSKVIEVTATAYSAEEHYTNQWTASGARARVGLIAVDPRVIPLGTRMYITSADGKSWVYGYAVAADTGGAIKGNKIDLYFNTVKECNRFGRRKAKVYILE
ncbi:MAG: 3D domain-containing protein [Clostridia bacterium]|nr:3D domain-containing protein [Clostridia bacterium]